MLAVCLGMLVLLVMAGFAAEGAAPTPSCTCATARAENGWCEAHELGFVASVEIHSRLLYDTMDAHGHVLDLTTFKCDTCKAAIATSGFCPQHRIGFVKGLAYFSRLTYELARGERRDIAAISCPTCRKNAVSLGWCDKCRIGSVGPVAIHDRQAFDAVAKAVAILREANRVSESCQVCAMAIVTDTTCPWHKITYKDGKPVPPVP